MSWGDLILFTLAGFGFVSLVIVQVREVMGKLPELVRDFYAVRRALREGRSDAGNRSNP